MVKISDELVQEIIELGHGNLEQQHKAFEHLFKIIFNKDHQIVDPSVVERLVPTFTHFLSSKDPWIQRSAAYCLAVVTETPDFKTNYKLIIKAGALPKLVQLLTLGKKDISKECLISLKNISYSFPIEVAKCNAISPLLDIIKSNIPLISFEAACVLKNLSHNRANIPAINDAGSIQVLINILKSNKNDMCQEALEIFVNIVSFDEEKCKMVLDCGALELVKKHFLHPSMKPFALEFIEKMLYSENEVDKIIDELVILLILKQLSSRDSAEIKIRAVKIVQTIIEIKPGYVRTLIDNDIILLLSDLLENKTVNLIMAALSALKLIITTNGYDSITQKLDSCNVGEKLEEFQEHENQQVKDLSTVIQDLCVHAPVVVDRKIKPDLQSELDEPGPSHRRRKPTTPQTGRSRNRKRIKTSMAQTETTDDDERNDDFDNIPSREASLDFLRPAEAETNENNGVIPNPLVNLVNSNEASTAAYPQNNPSNVIATFDTPSGRLIRSCCEQLGISYDRSQYLKFINKIKFTEIKSTSKPSPCLQSTTDRSGFSIFSMVFCGKDDPTITAKIKQTIKDSFMDKNYGLIDKATFISVSNSSTLTEEHIKVFAEHFNFRILVYFNEEWKKFGDFSSEETPLFLIEKKVAQDGINYQIILSLED